MGYFKKPKPETIATRILENKETYKFQIVELKKLVNDKDQSKFVRDMYQALVTGRKITPKMLDSINNIVKRNQPVEREKKRLRKERTLRKLQFLYDKLVEVRSNQYPQKVVLSMMENTHKWGRLTKKQMEFVNTIFEKNIKKSEKNT
tara:strand:- start:263 stop:703 length:441 start_codon:yes stop_codon:yes gene_type:complete